MKQRNSAGQVLFAFAVIGAFVTGGVLGSITGAETSHWSWEGSGNFSAAMAAVLLTYLAAPRYRLLLALCVLALGAIVSWATWKHLSLLGYWNQTDQPVIANCKGGITGLFLAVLVKRCSMLDMSTFRQWFLASLAIIGALVIAAIVSSVATTRMGYWNLPAANFCAPLAAVLVTYFAVPRYRLPVTIFVAVLLAVIFELVFKASLDPLKHAIASSLGSVIGLFAAYCVERQHIDSVSSFRQWFVGALAVIGAFIIGEVFSDFLGHASWDGASIWLENSLWGTLAAVLVTYLAAPKSRLISVFCTFVIGAIVSWFMLTRSSHFFRWDDRPAYFKVVASCTGGISGLFLIVLAKDRFTSNASASRQWLLVTLAVVGAFVTVGILGFIAGNRLGYWELPRHLDTISWGFPRVR